MALSTKARKRLEVAIANRALAKEIADLVDAGNINGGTVADVATANATDLPSSQALANQLKTTVNALLAALRIAGVIS